MTETPVPAGHDGVLAEIAARAESDKRHGRMNQYSRDDWFKVEWFAYTDRATLLGIVDSLRADRAAVIEECAALAENSYITGGFQIGPLYNAGWGGACKHIAAAIRALAALPATEGKSP